MSKIKKNLKKILPHWVIELYYHVNEVKQKIKNIYWNEHRKFLICNKRYPKIYYIRIRDNKLGLFGIVCQVISHCKYADSKGYVPVVDLKHYPNQYLDKKKLGKVNSWEFFFEQPTLVYDRKNRILSSGAMPDGSLVDPLYLINHSEELHIWQSIVKKYIRLMSRACLMFSNRENF